MKARWGAAFVILAACSSASSRPSTETQDASIDAASDAPDTRVVDAGTVCTIPGPCEFVVTIDPVSYSDGKNEADICPTGPGDGAVDLCSVNINFGSAVWSTDADTGVRTVSMDVLADDLSYIGNGFGSGGAYDIVLSGNPLVCPGDVVDTGGFIPAAITFEVTTSASSSARLGCDDVGSVTVTTDPSKIPVSACPYPQIYDDDSQNLMQHFFAELLTQAVTQIITTRACLTPVSP